MNELEALIEEERKREEERRAREEEIAKRQEQFRLESQGAPQFDPEGDSYDYNSAVEGGIYRDDTGHAGSRNPNTGQLLKGRGHETWNLAIDEELKMGNIVYRGADGKYYSNEAVPPDAEEVIAAPQEYIDRKKQVEEKRQHDAEIEQANLRRGMSQGLIQSARTYRYGEDAMFANMDVPEAPGREAGFFGATMQGVTLDRPDLFGQFGEGEPHGIVQNAAKFAGSMIPVVGGTLVARVPFGYALAEAGLQSTLASILAEVGGGMIGADVPFVMLADNMSTTEKGALVALGAIANALLPGSMRVGQLADTWVKGAGETIEGATKQGGVFTKFRDVITDAASKAEKGAEELTPNFLKPDVFQSPVAKAAVKVAGNYGEAVLDTFTQTATAIRENVDNYVLEQEARLKPWLLEPEEVGLQFNQTLNNEADRLFNYAGHLTNEEFEMAKEAVHNMPWRAYDPAVIENELAVRQSRALKEGVGRYSERILENVEETKDYYKGADENIATAYFKPNKEFSGHTDYNMAVMKERVNDFVNVLQEADDNAALRLRPFTTEKARTRFLETLDEVQQNINTAWQREEVKQMKQDLDQVVALMADKNIPLNVGEGYAMSAAAKGLPEAIITAADIYKARPDILETQLKELAEAITKNDSAAGIRYRDALREVEKYRHLAEHEQVDQVLKAYTNGEPIPPINTMSVYEASKAALKQQLRGEPEFADMATQVEEYAKFLPADQAMPYVQQLDTALEEEANYILGDWNKAIEAIKENPVNHRLEKNVVAYHSAIGTPEAKDYVQSINNQPTKMREEMAYMSADNTAHAEPTSPKPKGGVGGGDDPFFQGETNPDLLFQRAKVGSGFVSRNLGEFFANIGVYKREVEKLGDTQGVKLLSELEKEAQDFRGAYNQYVHEIAVWNAKINNLFNGWKKQPTLEGAVMHTVTTVSKEANDMRRAGKSKEEITAWIEDFVGKQSDDVKREYNSFRGMMDEQFTAVQNKVLDLNTRFGTEIPLPEYRPGYVHFAYEGEFVVKLSNGTSIPAESSTDLAAKLNELVERGHNFDDVSYQIIPRWGDAVEDFSLGDSVMKDGSAFGISHTELKQMYKTDGKFRPDTVMNTVWGGMETRMLELEKNKKGLYTSTSIATRLSTRYVNMIEPAIKMRAQYNKLQKAGFIKIANETKVWANDVLGISRGAEQSWDEQMYKIHDYINMVPGARYVADSFGMNEGARPLRSAMGLLAQAGRFLSIGFNPMTALLQTTIAPMNIFPLIGMGNFFKGLRHLSEFTEVGGRFEKLAIRSGVQVKNIDEIGKSGSAFGFQRRISKPRVTQTTLEAGIDKAEYYSMYMFNGTENVIRMASLWGAVKDAEKKGAQIIAGKEGKSHTYKLLKEISDQLNLPVSNPAVHDEYAYRMMNVMNFDFNTTGLNQLARNPFFKLPMQFKTYFFQEMEYILGRKIPLTPTERFKTLGAMIALGGIASLPFADELDDAMVMMTGKSPKLWMYENMPDVIAAGFPALVNINMSPLMQAGGTRSLALLPGIEGVLTNKLYRAYQEASTGQKTGVQAALGTSSLFRNFTEAYEMFTTGRILSPGGTAVVRRGGKAAAFGELLGIQTMQNTKSHELHSFYAGIKRKEIRQRTRDRKAILDARNPYRKGKELGYTTKDVDNMIENANKTRIEQSPKAQQILGIEGE